MEPSVSLGTIERQYGQKCYITGSFFNGIAFACLADNVLLLYAIANGIGPSGQGVLASLSFLCMPMILAGRFVVARFGLSKTWGACFFMRGASASLMILAPQLNQWIGPIGGQVVIMLGAVGFFAFRSAAASTFAATLGEITTPRDRGAVMARGTMGFWASYMFFLLIVALLLGLQESDTTYQGIILIGSIAGIYGGTRFWLIPETPTPRLSAKVSSLKNLSTIWNTHILRKQVFSQVAVYTATALVFSFSMLALKRGYGVSSQNALLFVMVLLSGNIIASKFCQLISDRVGPRPLLLIFFCGEMACALLWVLAPQEQMLFHLILVFFLVGFFSTGLQISMGHYTQTATPREMLVGVGMFCQLTGGVVGGLSGTIFGGFGIEALEHMGYAGMQPYRIYYAFVFLLLLAMFQLVRGLVPQKDWRIRDILGLIGSFRDMRTMMLLSRMGAPSTPDEEREQVDTLGDMQSPVSEKALLEYLDSPDFTIRYQAVSHLGRFEFGEEAARALIRELQEGLYTTAPLAALYLGKYKIREAIPFLRQGLDSEDSYLRSRCIYALSVMDDEESYPRIRELFLHSDNPRIIINAARALVRMSGADDSQVILNRLTDEKLPREVRREICLALTRMAECVDPYYRFIRTMALDEKQALRDLYQYISSMQGDASMSSDVLALLAPCEQGLAPVDLFAIVQSLAQKATKPLGICIRTFCEEQKGHPSADDMLYAFLYILLSHFDGTSVSGEGGAFSNESLTVMLQRDGRKTVSS